MSMLIKECDSSVQFQKDQFNDNDIEKTKRLIESNKNDEVKENYNKVIENVKKFKCSKCLKTFENILAQKDTD